MLTAILCEVTESPTTSLCSFILGAIDLGLLRCIEEASITFQDTDVVTPQIL